jgi:hypothetical protein
MTPDIRIGRTPSGPLAPYPPRMGAGLGPGAVARAWSGAGGAGDRGGGLGSWIPVAFLRYNFYNLVQRRLCITGQSP